MPSAWSSVTISLSAVARLAAKTTWAPALARATAQAAPMPEEAPTTRAFFPTKLKLGDAGKTILYASNLSGIAVHTEGLIELTQACKHIDAHLVI